MLDNWQTVARQLAKDYTVFLVDQRNHGRSPHLEEHSYLGMAEDLRQFMEDQFVLESHILGHSMGGKTAMHFAFEYPDMVDKLIVVDIAPRTYPRGHDEIFKALFELDLSVVKSRRDIDEQLGRYISETGVRQFLMKNIARDKEKGFQLRMNLPVIHKDYEGILQQPPEEAHFEGETLFIRGTKSSYIQADDLPLIQQYFPQGQLAAVKDSGHWVHAEQPAKLLELVQNFLAV